MIFAETDIYTYTVPGLGEVKVDPLMVRRGLIGETSGRCWEWSATANALEKELRKIDDADISEQANARRADLSVRLTDIEGKLTQASFNVFGLTPVGNDGFGVTETTGLRILRDYLTWIAEKKANAG